MRAVMPEALPDVIAWRKRRGLDHWDEMWGGELHMPPMPTWDHQDLSGALFAYLTLRWARPHKSKVLPPLNLAQPGGWPDDYRIPDLILVTPTCSGVNRDTHFEGAPDVVVEIRSPGDETYEKLSFYAKLGVPEVWVIDRDSKAPEIFYLRRGSYRKVRAVAGWVRSRATGIELCVGKPGKLAVRVIGDDSTREDLPED